MSLKNTANHFFKISTELILQDFLLKRQYIYNDLLCVPHQKESSWIRNFDLEHIYDSRMHLMRVFFLEYVRLGFDKEVVGSTIALSKEISNQILIDILPLHFSKLVYLQSFSREQEKKTFTWSFYVFSRGYSSCQISESHETRREMVLPHLELVSV